MIGSLADRYARWGPSGPAHDLDPRAAAYIVEILGPPAPAPAVPLAAVEPGPPRLGVAALAALAGSVGEAHVRTDRESRLAHAGGLSYLDLMERRASSHPEVPDAVVSPGSHDEVVALLAAAEQGGFALVPFGGGTSVVGGVRPSAGARSGVVAISFDRMAELLEVDALSGTARVQPGMTGPVLERLLAARGLTWGHVPQSWERASIGGYAATRSAGQSSTGYGRSDATVEAMVVATPRGTLRLGRAPSSAAGPDLRALFLGSEGILGVITEVTLRVRRAPSTRWFEAFMLPDLDAGLAAFRELAQARACPDVMRLSDLPETRATMHMSGPTGRTATAMGVYLRARRVTDGAMAVVGWDGSSAGEVRARRSMALDILRRHGAASLGRGAGESWLRHRFEGPYLRDTLMDKGYLVETVETATSWLRLPELRASVTGALSRSLGRTYVMAHVSHVYETGASLYITALASAGPEQAERWRAAKHAASQAIVGQGATITHHHGIGADHAPWLADEIGDVGVELLRTVKSHLDPQGILNPGVLLPTGG
ncbi:MAG TPA: FAD-binding oxidoreductase [Motilibacterales bacterium]|nr:FAD-binding oxidoreductase [Motilibacterales bacterium]